MIVKMLKPVTVQLVGGLGNQLFGYFAGRYVAKRLGTELLLDVSQFDKGITAHGSSIESFVLNERLVNLGQETRLPVLVAQNALNYAANKVSSLTRMTEMLTGIHTSKPIGIDPNILSVRPGMLMRGYYQTYFYVQEVMSDDSFNQLRLSKLTNWFSDLADESESARPIMVHVRRGDYAKEANRNWGMLDARYYQNAVARALHMIDEPDRPVWVFSDEIPLAKAELSQVLPNARFILPPRESPAAESLMLMSRGSANVISNSTFSWWSAILNADSVVVAPSKWFKNMPDPEGLVPPNWQIEESDWK